MVIMVDCTLQCPVVYDLRAQPLMEKVEGPTEESDRRSSEPEGLSNEGSASIASLTESSLGPASSVGHRDSYESAISVDPAVVPLPKEEAVAQKGDAALFRRSASAVVVAARRSFRLVGKRFTTLGRTLSGRRLSTKVKATPGKSLAVLSRKAEKRLKKLPEDDLAALCQLEDVMMNVVLSRELTSQIAAEVKSISIGQRLREAEASAVQHCDELRGIPGVAAALAEVMPAARSSSAQVLALLTEHLTAIGRGLYAQDVPAGLIPVRGCPLQVEERICPASTYTIASGLCSLQIVALLRLRRILAAYCDLAQNLADRARAMGEGEEEDQQEARALAASARATKRDICLLAGTFTNLMMEPFRQLLPLVQLAAHPRK